MNPESPLTPREEIEVRLTAMLMGELPSEEAAALEAQMADDAELTALHARLRQAIELLREACAIPDQPAPPVPAKFSSDRRERLLEHFKGASSTTPICAPAATGTVTTIIEPIRRDRSWIVSFGLAASLIALIGSLAVPEFASVGPSARRLVAQIEEQRSRSGAASSDASYQRGWIDGDNDRATSEKSTEAFGRDFETAAPSSSERHDYAESNRFASSTRSPAASVVAGDAAASLSTLTAGADSRPSTDLLAATTSPASGPATGTATPSARPSDSNDRALGGIVTGALRFGNDAISNEAIDGLVNGQNSTPAPIATPALEPPQVAGIAIGGGAGIADAKALANIPLHAAAIPSLIDDKSDAAKPADPASPSQNFFSSYNWIDLSTDFDTRVSMLDGTSFDRGKNPAARFGGQETDYFTGGSANGRANQGLYQYGLNNNALNANRPEDEKPSIFNGNINLADQSKPADTAAKAAFGDDGTTSNTISGLFYKDQDRGRAKQMLDLLNEAKSDPPATLKEIAQVLEETARHRELGQKHPALGDTDKLGNEYQRAPALDPNNQDARRGLAKIERTTADRFFAAQDHTSAKMLHDVDSSAGSEPSLQQDVEDQIETAKAAPATADSARKKQEERVAQARAKMQELIQQYGIVDFTPSGFGKRMEPNLGGQMLVSNGMQMEMETEKQINDFTQRLEAIKDKEGDALISAAFSMGIMDPKTNAVYAPYLQDQTRIQQTLSAGYDPKHPDVLAMQNRLASERRILDDSVKAIRTTLEDQLKMANATLTNMRRMNEKKKEGTIDEKAKIAEYQQAKEDRDLQVELLQKMVEEEEKAKLAILVASAESGEAEAKPESKPKEEDAPVRPPPPDAPLPQPEIETRANPFSTFSLNVSDVAYKLAQASLEKGEWPAAATVRSEEFINAFDYRDPEPVAGARLAFASERARYPFAHNRDLLRLSVKTAAAGRQPGRALNVVLLLDNSGSMERADRVQIVREALRVLATQLQPQDKLSIITFARTPRLVADGIAGDKAGEETARVAGITPQGGTNIAAALELGYRTALRHYQVSSINRVVLLTDGAANLGDVDPDALKQKVEAHRRQGIALDCFGVGWEGYNDNLLEVLSRNGDGRYGFINTIEAAATEFAGQLAGALRVAASDVKVQVEFNPRRVTAYRQIGYAKHQLTKEQFRDNTVDAAEIGAAESGNALYVIEVNPRGEGDIAAMRVRFRVPGTDIYREQEWSVPFAGNAPAFDEASPALRLAGTAAAFSEWLVSSPFAAEVTADRLLGYLDRVPAVYGADPRPQKLEWMIRQAKSLSGR